MKSNLKITVNFVNNSITLAVSKVHEENEKCRGLSLNGSGSKLPLPTTFEPDP